MPFHWPNHIHVVMWCSTNSMFFSAQGNSAMLPSNISAYVFDTVEGMTQKLSRDPLIRHAQNTKVLWVIPLTPFSQHCLTCFFTWLHNDYCIRSKTKKKTLDPSKPTEIVFGIYTSWKLVWRFTREIECWVSYLVSWIEIIRNWSALLNVFAFWVLVFLEFESLWYNYNKTLVDFYLEKNTCWLCCQCSVLHEAGNEGSGDFPFASHNQQ